MVNNDVPKGITVVSDKPIVKLGRKHYDWLALKQEYLMSPDKTLEEVALEHGVPPSTLNMKSRLGGWAKERQVLYMKVDHRAQDMQVEKLAELKSRHALIGKFLQTEGVRAIKKGKVHIKSAKDALEYAVEGVKMEREAAGLDKQSPQIVNILAQQQGVIDKYKQ